MILFIKKNKIKSALKKFVFTFFPANSCINMFTKKSSYYFYSIIMFVTMLVLPENKTDLELATSNLLSNCPKS